MSAQGTLLHRLLLTSESTSIIKAITGWSVDGGWDVSSRRWQHRLPAHYVEKGEGENLVTVFHYGKRAVVFLDTNLLSFTAKYRASDFDGPSTLTARTKYEFFDDHKDHKDHCHTCHPRR